MRSLWLAVLIACGAPAAPATTPIDSDADGIVGDADGCPTEPEDRDGFQDDDGCPDPDNDGDGILDPNDLCTEQPEDIDLFQDDDGCPDPDNDDDRILDANDQCPCRPETYNDFEDEDGCPDCPRVQVNASRITIRAQVHFPRASSVLEPAALAIIDEVAQVLLQFEEIQVVAVQGHASRGERRAGRLAEERAALVVAAIVARGVAAERLVAEGFGTARPLDARRSPEARAINRRVDFELRQHDLPPSTPRSVGDCGVGPVAGCGS